MGVSIKYEDLCIKISTNLRALTIERALNHQVDRMAQPAIVGQSIAGIMDIWKSGNGDKDRGKASSHQYRLPLSIMNLATTSSERPAY